jgi:hypothetical protein
VTAPLLTEDALAAANINAAVARGADNVRKLAIYFHVDDCDADFRAALDAALDDGLIKYTDGCHFGGGHTLSCELETIR